VEDSNLFRLFRHADIVSGQRKHKKTQRCSDCSDCSDKKQRSAANMKPLGQSFLPVIITPANPAGADISFLRWLIDAAREHQKQARSETGRIP
jgi:hypothetical protein